MDSEPEQKYSNQQLDCPAEDNKFSKPWGFLRNNSNLANHSINRRQTVSYQWDIEVG